MQETAYLTASSLYKKYNGRAVVKDVSFTVQAGEIVGLLGPNGAGKTTCFYMATGLVKPDKGAILLNGFDVTGLPMYRLARLGVGYLAQENCIFRSLSVEDNIKAALECVEKNKEKRSQQLEKLLQDFQIGHLRALPAIALSGGEKRRLELARALACQPLFMLLDEPFAGVDPIAIGEVQILVRSLKERGLGVLITDHNVRETLSLVDRAYIIHEGAVLAEGAAAQIIDNAKVRQVYLGSGFSL